MDDEGNFHAQMRPQIGWEMWPLWLRVGIDHERDAYKIRPVLAAAPDGEPRAEALAAETRACMVAISACAFALEAMANSAAHAAGIRGVGRNASAGRRIAEVLKQCFVIPHSQFAGWRQALIEIFECRNNAVHADAGLRDPLPHPAIPPLVPRPAHVYRLENAIAAVDVTLSTALVFSKRPRPRLGKVFAERLESWQESAEELRAVREGYTRITGSDLGG
jgi:hypothetical protein